MRNRFAPESRNAARPARSAAVAALTGLMLALPAVPALAHAEIDPDPGLTSPAPSSTVAQVPGEVKMTFTSPVAAESTATIVDGCGSIVSGASQVDGATVVVAVAGDAQPGPWSVSYRNLSLEDGHTGTGEYTFTVSGTPDCGADPAGTDQDQQDQATDTAKSPTGVGAFAGLAVFAVAAVAATVAVLFVRRGRARRE